MKINGHLQTGWAWHERGFMVANLANVVIITVIYMFVFSLYLTEKTHNGKHYVSGRVSKLL